MAIEINIESQIQPFDNVAEFPATGAEKTIYIAKDINAAYYWNGSAYILIVDPTEVVWGDITGDLLNQLDLINALDLKVDKVAGKGLSQEDYTTAEKSKLAGIEAGAEVNVNADWNATSGDAEILNKPDLSTYATNSELAAGLATKENAITAGTTAQYFRGDKTFQTLDKAAVGLGNVDNTSDANKPISTATQTALNAKQDLLGFTPENAANKSTSVVTDQASNTKYPSVKALYDWAVGLFATIAQLATKQDTLVSGTNIKTVFGQSLLGSGNVGYLYRNFTQGANVTGTTSEVQVLQVLIPANTFTAIDKLTFFAVFSRVTALNVASIRAKISTSPTMPTGSTGMVARVNPSANGIYVKFSRDLIIEGGNIKGLNNNTPVTSDAVQSAAIISLQPFDASVNNYFYISVSLAVSTDDIRIEAVEIKTI